MNTFIIKLTQLLVFVLLLVSCSSPFLKNEEPLKLSVEDDIPEVKVKEIGEDPNNTKNDSGVIPDGEMTTQAPTVPSQLSTNIEKMKPFNSAKRRSRKGKKIHKSDTSKEGIKIGSGSDGDWVTKVGSKSKEGDSKEGEPKEAEEAKPREPTLESDVGFKMGSRRPEKDPFRVGERVTMSVRYFKAQAGELTLEVKPMVEVNGRKSYRWYTALKTTGMFSRFYSVEDWAETLVDFETLIPSVFNLQVKESAQLKNAKGYFDIKSSEAIYAERKYTEKKGHEEKHQKWKFAPYSQNVFSAAFYMRVFSYEVGKEYKFYVSDDEKNLMFKGRALRKEKIETDAGEFNTIVVKPEFEVDGVFKPVGDIFFWLTDDDRKFIVKIESEIKIGTLVMEATKVDRAED